jgi:hypothetical protein
MGRLSILVLAAAGVALAVSASSTGCTPVERKFGGGGGGGGSSSSSGTGGETTSSSSSSGASTSSSSSSGTGKVETDCTNGADDDGDGLTDCEDPDCTGAGYQCAADAPPGWVGPAVLFAGLGAPPACNADWTAQPVAGGLDVSSPPAGCSACTCSPPTNMFCDNFAFAIIANDPQCQNGPSNNISVGQCFSPGFSAPYVSVSPPKALGGNCQPGGGIPNLPPAGFKTQAALCDTPAAVGGGCSAGACVPKAPAGYGPSVCIYTQGDTPCPGAPYVNRTVVYGSIDDARGCDLCSCAPPLGGVCQGGYTVFGGVFPGCAQSFGGFPADGQCYFAPTSQNVALVLQNIGAPTGGTCAPSGGQPIGQAMGGSPMTVCCQ